MFCIHQKCHITTASILSLMVFLLMVNLIQPSLVSAAGAPLSATERSSNSVNAYGVKEDVDLMKLKAGGLPAESEWNESEKALYRGLLRTSSFDVLIVPFQVQGYAVDRIGRSLMTRYLSDRIESSSDLKIPDPTLVSRALGVRSRIYDDEEIYRLADELKVKVLIRGYVGHNRDERLVLTLVVQKRDQNGNLNPATKVTQLDWHGIPFSDQQPPSEAFYLILDDIISKLDITKGTNSEAQHDDKAEIVIPASISEMVKAKPSSPIMSAYNLQLLGSLYPAEVNDLTEKEHYFERSLVALKHVSPTSPDYAILKARAFFNLHRRPAAIEILKSVNTPEGKALSALLNGNLPEFEKQVKEIKSPAYKLIAQIELNDLRLSYGHEPDEETTIRKISEGLPGWEMMITRRIQSRNQWALQSNQVIKQSLDAAFPLSDNTAEPLNFGLVTSGQLPSEDEKRDFSIYSHFVSVLRNGSQKFCCLSGSYYPVERDYLSLLYAIGEANILKKIRLVLFTQALYEQGLETINRYEALYKGHIEFTYMKARALTALARNKDGKILEEMHNSFQESSKNICFWSQGQMGVAAAYHCGGNYYCGDYPARPYWTCAFDTLDRNELKKDYRFGIDLSSLPDSMRFDFIHLFLALLYTHDNFSILEDIYNKLSKQGMHKEADAVLEANKYRFIGHPGRSRFEARIMERRGDIDMLIRSNLDAIASTPEVWGPYRRIGELYLKQGDFKKAFDIFNRYPLFAKKEGEHVSLSNIAFDVGVEFYRRGAIDEARHFLQLSASYNTGSGAEMTSLGLLALLEAEYGKAASGFLNLGERYNSSQGYGLYMDMLHLLGHHKESWELLNTLAFGLRGSDMFIPILIGFRMEGIGEEEQLQWLLSKKEDRPIPEDASRYLFISNIMDRPLNAKLSNIIENVYSQLNTSPKQPPMKRRGIRLCSFADGYYSIRKGDFDSARDIFNTFKVQFLDREKNISYKAGAYAVPYYAWSNAKVNNFDVVEDYLESIKSASGEDFYYHLSKAFINGAKSNHEAALQHLKRAQYNIPAFDWKNQPLHPWYQLIETCEMLYEDTGYKGYKDIALKWAQVHQKIYPMYAWAYAVEAKLTDSAPDRLKALALTLYLDKRSERISKFSESDKALALEWLKNNNPFLKESIKPCNRKI